MAILARIRRCQRIDAWPGVGDHCPLAGEDPLALSPVAAFSPLGAPLFLALITVHVLFVSETYASGPPRLAILLIAGLFVLLF